MSNLLRLFWIAISKIREGWLVLHIVLIGVPAWFALVLFEGGNFIGFKSFSVMASLMDEWQWSAVSGLVAILSAFGWNGKAWWSRIGASLLLMSWHTTISVCFFLSSPLGTAGGTYFLLALASFFELVVRINSRNRFDV